MPFLVLAALGSSHTGNSVGACRPINSGTTSDYLQVSSDQRQVASLLVSKEATSCWIEKRHHPTLMFGGILLYELWESTHRCYDTVTYQQVYFSHLPVTDWLTAVLHEKAYHHHEVWKRKCLPVACIQSWEEISMSAQGIGHTEVELGYNCLLFISTLMILHKVVCLKVSEYAIIKQNFLAFLVCFTK